MAVLVGIDEAGFGPILGPLVVSSTAFSLPYTLLSEDLWQILHKSVAQQKKHLAGRILITDSKKAKTKSHPIKYLQRTTLTSLKTIQKQPVTLTDLLTELCPDCLDRLQKYPWYEKIANHKLLVDTADIQIASNVFKNDLDANNMELLEIKTCCLDVAYYNKLVTNIKNKANVLFTCTSQLIKNAWDNYADNDLQLIIDRQGGRVHYRETLQKIFPQMEMKILKESPANSSYELKDGSRKMRLHFAVKADSKFLPVSLASMVSKYLRELMIENINSYFIDFHDEIKPTAGYWKDGLRFIQDLKTNIPHIKYDNEMLIRSR